MAPQVLHLIRHEALLVGGCPAQDAPGVLLATPEARQGVLGGIALQMQQQLQLPAPQAAVGCGC